ncbi:MAG: hypothetical protein FGM32_04315, partial [Candidatus Kapabacteria bacterium]|nr:hypothetical protein [Candidatus Kapabacteria bacterium]
MLFLRMLLLLCGILCTALSLSAQTTWYVRKNGATTGAGTLANPYRQIADIPTASLLNGDLIDLGDGDFDGTTISVSVHIAGGNAGNATWSNDAVTTLGTITINGTNQAVTIEGVRWAGGTVPVASEAPCQGAVVTITNTHFDQAGGINATALGGWNELYISDCEFDGADGAFTSTNAVTASGLSIVNVSENRFREFTQSALSITAGNLATITVRSNEFAANNSDATAGRSNRGAVIFTGHAGLTSAQIQNNVFDGDYNGVVVNDPVTSAISVRYNKFLVQSGTHAVKNIGTSGPLSATCNNYGANAAPSAVRSALSGSITALPYNFEGADVNGTDIGFEPNASQSCATNGPVKSSTTEGAGTSYFTITEAINASAIGAVVRVLADTYDENLSITKRLTLLCYTDPAGKTPVNLDTTSDGRTRTSFVTVNGVVTITSAADQAELNGFKITRPSSLSSTSLTLLQTNASLFTKIRNCWFVTSGATPGLTSPANGVVHAVRAGDLSIWQSKVDRPSSNDYMRALTFAAGNGIRNVRVERSTVQGSLQMSGLSALSKVVVDNNNITDAGIDGVAVTGNYAREMIVTNNTITNARENGVAWKNGASVGNGSVTVTNNLITGSGMSSATGTFAGIFIGSATTGGTTQDYTNNSVHSQNTGKNIINQRSGLTPTATCSWWGSLSEDDILTAFTGSVLYDDGSKGWRSAATNAATENGYTPSGNNCTVRSFTLALSKTNIGCNYANNGSVTATPTFASGDGAASYSWNSTPAQATATASGLAAGTYSVTVTSNSGNFRSSSAVILNPSLITATLAKTNVSCNGAADATITVTGAAGGTHTDAATRTYSYRVVRSGGSVDMTNTTGAFTGLSAGTYTVSVIAAAIGSSVPACTTSVQMLVDVDVTNTTAVHIGDSGPLRISEGALFFENIDDWVANSFTTGSASVVLKHVRFKSQYSESPNGLVVKIFDNAGNVPGDAIATLSSAVADGDGYYVFNATSDVNLAANTKYWWVASFDEPTTTNSYRQFRIPLTNGNSSPGDGFTFGFQAQARRKYNATGHEWFGVDDQYINKFSLRYVTLGDARLNNPSTVSATVTKRNIACAGASDGTITVSATGGTHADATTRSYSYSAVKVGGGYSQTNTTGSFTGLGAGSYDVSVIVAASGSGTNPACTTSAGTMVIYEPSAVTATVAKTNISCNGSSDGTITVSGTSGGTHADAGSRTYQYMVARSGGSTTGPQTSSSFTGLQAGTYTVSVIAQSTGASPACTTAVSTQVIYTPLAVTATVAKTNISCNGANDGTLTVTGTSGGTHTDAATRDYSYRLVKTGGGVDVTNTTGAFTGLGAGTYTISAIAASSGSGVNPVCTTAVSTPVIYEPSAVTAAGYAVNFAGLAPFRSGNKNVAGPLGPAGAYQSGWNNIEAGQKVNGGVIAASNDFTITNASGGGPISMNMKFSNEGGNAGDGAASTNDFDILFATSIRSNDAATTVTSTSTIPFSTYSVYLYVTGATFSVNGRTDAESFTSSNGFTTTNTKLFTGLSGPLTFTQNNNTLINGFSIIGSGSMASKTNITCAGANDGTISIAVMGGTHAEATSRTYTYSAVKAGGGYSQTNATGSFTGLGAGSYDLTVIAAASGSGTNPACTTAAGTVVIYEPSAVTSTISSTNVLCNGNSNGTITVSGTSGGTHTDAASRTYRYMIARSGGSTTGPQTAGTFTGLQAGTYTVSVIAQATGSTPACTTSASVTITQPLTLVASIASQENVSCFGGSNGTATAGQTGGTSPYTYLWSNTQTTETATGLAPGTYSVTVTDSKGCTASATATITQPPVLSASIASQTNVSCNGASTGTVTASQAGGTSPYTYSWSNGQTTQTATGLAAGTYSVTVTDSKNCTASATATITEPTAVSIESATQRRYLGVPGSESWQTAVGYPVNKGAYDNGVRYGVYDQVSFNGTDYVMTVYIGAAGYSPTGYPANWKPLSSLATISCNGASNGGIKVSASGGTGTLQYSINNSTWQTSNTFEGLAPNTYTVYVKDANSCQKSLGSIVITQPTVLAASIASQVNVSCNGGSDGTATVSASGGTSGYRYSWNTTPVQTTITATGLSAGTYTVTVQDANNCSATASAIITQPTVVTIASAAKKSYGSYFENPANWSSTASSGTTSRTVTTSGGSEVMRLGHDSKQFSATFVHTITAPESGVVAFDWAVRGCHSWFQSNASVRLWVGNTGNVIQTYYNQYGGCDWMANGTSSFHVTAGTQWGYTVTGSHFDGSYLLVGRVDIVRSTSRSDISCTGAADGGITVTASGGTGVLQYSKDDGTSYQTSNVFTGLSAGTYGIKVKDANNCVASTNVTISEPTVVTLSSASTNKSNNGYDVSCFGNNDGSITVTASGGTGTLQYSKDNGSNYQLSNVFTGLVAGTYSIKVKDNNNCTATTSATITQPPALTVAIVSSTNVSCNGGNNGTASASASGGTTDYRYSWNTTPARTTAAVTGLSAGTYTVTVLDANNCSATASVVITQPPALVASIDSKTDVLCFGGNDGAATVNRTGGTSPYTYLWSSGQTTQSITGLVAGTYSITVTDAQNCSSLATVTIAQPSAAVAIASPSLTHVACNNGATGAADITVSGGTVPYSYTWTKQGADGTYATTEDLTGLTSGTYTIVVNDKNGIAGGCTATTTIVITQPELPVSINVAGQTNVVCNGGSTGTIGISVGGGTPPYSYNWSKTGGGFTSTSKDLSGLTAGTYSVTVNDNNGIAGGCTDSKTIVVTEPSAPVSVVVSSSQNIACNGTSTGEINITASGGTAPYTYSWTKNGSTETYSTTEDLTGLSAGTYTIVVTDVNGNIGGCRASTSVTILEPTAITATVTKTNISCNGSVDGSITVSGASGGTHVSSGPRTFTYQAVRTGGGYSQTTSDGSFTGLGAGTYTVSVIAAAVTDVAPACTTSVSTVAIFEPTALSAAGYAVNFSGLCRDCSGNKNVTGTLGPVGAEQSGWVNVDVGQPVNYATPGLSYNFNATNAAGIAPISMNVQFMNQGGNAGGGTTSTSAFDILYATGIRSNGRTTTVTSTSPIPFATYSVYLYAPSAATYYTVNGRSNPESIIEANGFTTTNTKLFTGLSGPLTITQRDNTMINGFSIIGSGSLATKTNITCAGASDGTISVSVTGGTHADATTRSYSYSAVKVGGGYSQTNATGSFTGLGAGSYDVSVIMAASGSGTNPACTTSAGTMVIYEPSALTATVAKTNISCNGSSNGTITVSGTSGGTHAEAASRTYQYTIARSGGSTTGPQTSGSFTGLQAGTYTVSVIAQSTGASPACTTAVSTQVIYTPLAVTATVAKTNISCNGANDGTLTVTGTSGGTHTDAATRDYSYRLVKTGGGVDVTNTTGAFTGLGAGTYTISAIAASSGSGVNPVCTTAVSTPVIYEPSAVTAAGYAVNFAGLAPFRSGNKNVAGPLGPAGAYQSGWNNIEAGQKVNGGVIAASNDFTITNASGGGPISMNMKFSNEGGNAGDGAASTNDFDILFATSIRSNDAATTVTSTSTIPFSTYSVYLYVTGATFSVNGRTDAESFTSSNGFTTTNTKLFTGLSGPLTFTQNNNTLINGFSIIGSGSMASKTNITCAGANDGTISIAVMGGTHAEATSRTYTYSAVKAGGGYSQTNATGSFTGLGAGSYDLTVIAAASGSGTNPACTTAAGTVVIYEPSAVTSTISSTNVLCNGNSNGTITVSGTSGGTHTDAASRTYRYMIARSGGSTTGPQTAGTFTGLQAGTYTVSVIAQATGSTPACTTSASVTITQPLTLVASIASQENVSCFGGSNGTATAGQTGGTSPYTYLWSNTQTTETATGLAPGTYSVTVTDSKGCTASATATITQPPVLSASIASQTNVSCNGASTGTVTASQAGGTSPYTYSWSNGQTTQTATGLAAGTYSVTVTDSKNCTASATATITEPTAVSIESATQRRYLGVPGSESWQTAVGYPVNKGAYDNGVRYGVYDQVSFNGTDYVMTVYIGAAGYSPTGYPANWKPLSSLATISCNGASNGGIKVSASGGTGTLQYSINNSTWQTSNTFEGLAPNTYTVYVKDANSCQKSLGSIVITQPTVLAASIASQVNVSCNGGSDGTATVSASGGTSGYRYSWNTTPVQTTITATGLSAGTYTVTVQDANNCSATASAIITQPTVVTIASAAKKSYGSYFENPANWSSTASSGTTSRTVTTSGGSEVMRLGHDSKQFSATFVHTITAPESGVVAFDWAVRGCHSWFQSNASVRLWVGNTGNVIQTYYNQYGGCDWMANGTSSFHVTAGTQWGYTVTGSHFDGSYLLVGRVDIVRSTSRSDISCTGAADGGITVTASGGTGVLQYSKDDGTSYQTSNVFTGLSAGTYGIKVKDANNCVASTNVTISEPTVVTLSSASTNKSNNGYDVSCFGNNDGSITVTASGGTGTLQYSKDNGSNYQLSNVFTGLVAGTYSIKVKDNNNCTATTSATITQPPALTVAIVSSTNVSCNGGNNGTASASASGGTTDYRYSWNTTPARTTAAVTGLSAGTYTVTVLDANNCSATANVVIYEPSVVTATVAKTNISCNGSSDGTITVSGTSGGTHADAGSRTYQYSIARSGGSTTGPQTSSSFTGLQAGTYTVSVIAQSTGANPECSTAVSTQVIYSPSAVAATVAKTNISCNGANDGTLTVTGTSGGTNTDATTRDYSYRVVKTGGGVDVTNTTGAFTGLGAGTYTVSVIAASSGSGVNPVCTTTVATPVIYEPSVVTAAGYAVNFNGIYGQEEGKNVTGVLGPFEPITVYDPIPPGGRQGGWTNVNMGTSLHGNYYNTSVNFTMTNAAGGGPVAMNITVQNDGGNSGNGTTSTNDFDILFATGVRSESGTTTISTKGTIPFARYSVYLYATGEQGTNPYTVNGRTNYSLFTSSNGFTTSNTKLFGGLSGPLTITHTSSYNSMIHGFTIVPETSAFKTNITCAGANDGTISISVTGGTHADATTRSYSYSAVKVGGGFSQTNATGSFTGLGAGSYDVTVIVAASGSGKNPACTTSAGTMVIYEPSTVTASVAKTNISCNGSSDGTITVSGTSGGTHADAASRTYRYMVARSGGSTTGPQTSSSFTGLQAGTYTVSVVAQATGANPACTTAVSTQVIYTPSTVASTVVKTNISCNGANDGTLTVTGTSGGTHTDATTRDYSYRLVKTGGGVDVTNTTGAFTGLGAGTYTVSVIAASSGSGVNPVCTTAVSTPVIYEPTAVTGATYAVNFSGLCNNCTGNKNVTGTLGPVGANQSGWVNVDVGHPVNGPIIWLSYNFNATNAGGVNPISINVQFRNQGGNAGGGTTSTSAFDILYATGIRTNSATTTLTSTSEIPFSTYSVYLYALGANQWYSVNGRSNPETFTASNGFNTTNTKLFTGLSGPLTITQTAEQLINGFSIVGSGSMATKTNITCAGANDGTITLSVMGGTHADAPTRSYSYSAVKANGGYSQTNTSGLFTGLSAGTYDLTVVAAASGSGTNPACTTAAGSVVIYEPSVVTATVAKTNISCNGSSDGTITVSGTSGGTHADAASRTYRYMVARSGG